MTSEHTARRSHRRMPRPGDERGSLAMLLMVTIVGLMLSALLVPVIITQDRATRFDKSRVHALDAAQAGVDTALGLIRAAVDSTGIGDSSQLPCGPLSGTVDSTGPAAYSVTIAYFTVDPVKFPSATPMICAAGFGTYDAPSGAFTPSFARLSSFGTDGTAVNGASAGRTVITTYVIKTSNTNIPGGVIRLYPAAGSTVALCMDAGSTTPSAGTVVVMQACSITNPPVAQQVFTYRTDLTIHLPSSVTTTYPNGLCLNTTAAPTAGNTITLSACLAVGVAPPYTQQWSFNDAGAYQASLANSRNDGTLSGVCMNVASQTAGLQIKLATCDGSVSSAAQAWIPAPSVGAGAAAAPQLINYAEFGRCLDVTGQNVAATHLIDYPCKQNPFAGAVAWNQKFTTPPITAGQTNATGLIYTTTSSTNYCLTKPSAGLYVTVAKCISPAAASQTWTVYNGFKTLPYATKFTIVDPTAGLCLGLTAPVTGEPWSAIDLEACTGASKQKWNADANLSTPSLQNTTEH